MIIAPRIGAELALIEIPKDCFGVDPELDLDGARGTYWVDIHNLDAITARDYITLIAGITARMDPERIVQYDRCIEVTEVTYGEAVSAWVAVCHSDEAHRAEAEAYWQSDAMAGLSLPPFRLEVVA